MRKWYQHGWNTDTSLWLIRGIIPRVPRSIVPAIAVPTTLISMAYMRDERKAVSKNLARILGTRGLPLQRATFRLFYNFSKFMVSYCELQGLTAELVRSRSSEEPEDGQRVARCLAEGRGVIILTAHLGNWEAGLRLLEGNGTTVNVAMQVDPESPVELRLAAIRQRGSVRIIPIGEDPSAILALRAALERNEILAMQGDRASGSRSIPTEIFGAPLSLPFGPFFLAYLTGAALLPAFFIQEGWWRFRSEIREPIVFPRTGDRDADLAAAAAAYGAVLEEMVGRYPDQWFNFFDAWRREDAETGKCVAAAG